MRCLVRNKRTFFYALYLGREAVRDEYGNVTGEYRIVYGKPKRWSANISAAQGKTSTLQFGENVSYDKSIVMENNLPQIDEYSVLWVDTVPLLEADGSLAVNDEGEVITPHDYIVKRVAVGLNGVAVAISKVQVS